MNDSFRLLSLLLLLATSSSALAQGFSISVTPEHQSVMAGEKVSFVIHVTPQDGFSASVFLQVHSDQFAASEISLDVSKVNAPYTATATLTVSPQPGNTALRTIIIEARNADLVATDTVSLTVVVPTGKDQWITYDTANSILPSNTINDIAFDRNDVAWIATSEGLVRWEQGGGRIFNRDNAPFESNFILSIAIDSSNGVWVSTFDDNANDIYCYRDSQWTGYRSNLQGYRGINKTSIAVAGDSTIWMTTHRGVMKFHRGEWSIYSMTNSGLTWDFTGDAAVTATGDLWVSAGLSTENPDNRSLMKFDGRFWTAYSLADLGLERSEYFSSIAIGPKGNIWLASNTRLVELDDHAIETLPLPHAFFHGWHALAIAPDGVVWFSQPSTNEWGIGSWNGSEWRRYGSDNSGFPAGRGIASITPRRDGSIWLGTNFQGLVVFRPAAPTSNVIETSTASPAYGMTIAPNPLRSRGNLELTSSGGPARITLHNSMGRQVAVLFEGTLLPGRSIVKIDVTSLSPGAYLLSLEQDGAPSRSQMILVTP
jgi:ligand-binding sensor domain-containing protein